MPPLTGVSLLLDQVGGPGCSVAVHVCLVTCVVVWRWRWSVAAGAG